MPNSDRSHPPNSPLRTWIAVVVILGAILLGTGAVIGLTNPAMLVGTAANINEAVRVYAGYLASRNLAIAAMLLIALGIRARGALRMLMVLTAVVQIIDAVIDCVEGRWLIVPGVLVLGGVYLVAASRMSPRPLMMVNSWRDPD